MLLAMRFVRRCAWLLLPLSLVTCGRSDFYRRPGSEPESDLLNDSVRSLTHNSHLIPDALQAQHDVLQGFYPVTKEEASELCAFQIQARHASTLLDDDDGIMMCIEKFIMKQVMMGWDGMG
jgi:hypothetical protein